MEAVDALLASGSDTFAGVGYNMRFLGIISLLTGWLSSGALGTPYFARIEVGQDLKAWRSSRDYRDAYSVSTARGGGVARDLSHEIDYMRVLFGDPTDWTVHTGHTGAVGGDVEDIFEGTYSFAGRFICSVHMDYLEGSARRTLALVTSLGRLTCDFIGGTLTTTMHLAARSDQSSLFDMAKTYRLEVSAFADAVAGRAAWPGATLSDGRRVLELIGSS
jgi:predicted dehydrogenase